MKPHAQLRSLGRVLVAGGSLALIFPLVLLLFGTSPQMGLAPGPGADSAGSSAAQMVAARRASAELPLRFVANVGQADERVRYLAHGTRHAVFFTPDAVVVAALDGGVWPASRVRPVSFERERSGEALALTFLGANPDVRIEGRRELRGRANYLIGRDPSSWRVELSTFAEVVYRDLWPGIDMVFRQSRGQLKYDLVVAPGASPEVIRLAYRGVERVDLDRGGNLRLTTERGVRQEPRPVSYQEIGGRRVPVESRFAVANAGGAAAEIGFAVGPYDARHPLVIDPALVYSTFLGGANQDIAAGVAVDGAGHVYVAGFTVSTDVSHQARRLHRQGEQRRCLRGEARPAGERRRLADLLDVPRR